MEFAMTLTKWAAVALAVTLGISLSAPSATTALADPALPAIATQSYAASHFHNGDHVRLRSGGPLMTVTSIQDDQVMCAWSEPDGQLRSEHIPATLLAAPITAPLYIE
jgi:uncharacterized protein YodC (DUF2158 family)